MNDNNENKLQQCAELNDEQLEDVSGGTDPEIVCSYMVPFKRCSRNHEYIGLLKACPECGSTEYTVLKNN